MIYDILEVFKKEYEKNGDKLILDNYTLKDGLYVKVNKDNSCEYFIAETVKKEKIFKTIDGTSAKNEIDWFKSRDYYSNVIDTAKSYDAPKKTIHNNNYLTLFMKIEAFLNVEFAYLKEKLYRKVFSFKSFKSKNEKKILNNFCNIIKPYSRKKDLIQKMKILKKILESIKEMANNYSPKEYVRIYFEDDVMTYKNESNIYLALKNFNDNKYSIEIEKIVYGLSNYNMGLNNKKVYLEQKTKKLPTPFMVTPEIGLQIKLFFDWLVFQPYGVNILESIYLNKHSDNGKSIVNDFEYIPLKIEKLKNPIYVTNYLKAKDFKTKKFIEDYTIKELYQLETKVDEIFYNKQLTHNYFNDIKVSQYISKNLQTLLYETKTSMLNYFKKYDDRAFYQVIKKYGSDFVIEHLRQNRELKAKENLNLKLSLLKHKGENIMDIQNIQKEMINKLVTSNYETLESEEFFYLCGQVTKYLLSQSEAFQKNADLLEPFLRANSAKKLKKDIEITYFKYKHKISLNHIKFNNALSLVMAYAGVDKLSLNMDSFLVGVLSDNIFYMKKEEEK